MFLQKFRPKIEKICMNDITPSLTTLQELILIPIVLVKFGDNASKTRWSANTTGLQNVHSALR